MATQLTFPIFGYKKVNPRDRNRLFCTSFSSFFPPSLFTYWKLTYLTLRNCHSFTLFIDHSKQKRKNEKYGSNFSKTVQSPSITIQVKHIKDKKKWKYCGFASKRVLPPSITVHIRTYQGNRRKTNTAPISSKRFRLPPTQSKRKIIEGIKHEQYIVSQEKYNSYVSLYCLTAP